VRKTVASLVAIAGLTAGLAPAAHACPNVSAGPAQMTETQAQVSTICLINKRRTRFHLHAVRGDMQLSSAARAHSQSMGTMNFFSHFGDGTPETRAAATGYISGGGHWGIGEDLGWGAGGMGTPGYIVASWMASPVHRAVILTRRFRQIGVGVTDASPTGTDDGVAMIYTAVFGFHHAR
jgi:uncharacterized protein YkwD